MAKNSAKMVATFIVGLVIGGAATYATMSGEDQKMAGDLSVAEAQEEPLFVVDEAANDILPVTIPEADASAEANINNEKIIAPAFTQDTKGVTNYLSKNLKYPERAEEEHQQGRVGVLIHIDEQGKVFNTKVVTSAGEDLDQAVLDVINKMPNWKPATVNGKAVKSSLFIPVKFQL